MEVDDPCDSFIISFEVFFVAGTALSVKIKGNKYPRCSDALQW